MADSLLNLHGNGNGNDKPATSHLDRITTMDSTYITPETHEKLYLSPETPVKGELRKTFGNPTPVALGGFLLANTPATCMLMGWGGAGAGVGNAAADTAAYYWMGALLLVAGGIGEWILGNTFPSVVFFTFGGFWGTFGGTLTPFYAAISSYTKTNAAGETVADPAGFYNSFAFFLIFMALLCLTYMIVALRTNILLVIILFSFVLTFPLLAASYFYAARGVLGPSANCRIAGGACAFVGSMVAWYLWLSLLFESVDFPIQLPVGDLSTHVRGFHEKERAERRANRAAAASNV